MTRDQAREGTPPWEQDELIEKAARAYLDAIGHEDDPDRYDLEVVFPAVLAAVGPHIAAQAWDEGYVDGDSDRYMFQGGGEGIIVAIDALTGNYNDPDLPETRNPYAREDADR